MEHRNPATRTLFHDKRGRFMRNPELAGSSARRGGQGNPLHIFMDCEATEEEPNSLNDLLECPAKPVVHQGKCRKAFQLCCKKITCTMELNAGSDDEDDVPLLSAKEIRSRVEEVCLLMKKKVQAGDWYTMEDEVFS